MRTRFLNCLMLVAFCVAGLAFVSACSSDSSTAGTVTDTGNTIATTEAEVAGVVHRADGSVAVNATVRMARLASSEADSYEIPESRDTVTDSAGRFAFAVAMADTFQLVVFDSLASEIFYLPYTTSKSDDYDSIRLEKAALFNGVLLYEEADSAVKVGSHFIVSLTGTPFFQSVFAGDSFSLMIPAGTGWMSFFPWDPEIVAKLQDSGVADSLIYRRWELKDSVAAGDTVTQGPFIWSIKSDVDSLIKEEEEVAKVVSRISGTVICKSGKPCDSVEVMLITDLYGFDFVEGDSVEFVVNAKTDSLGRWWLPVPESVPEDSFRVEYRLMMDGFPVQVGVSRYVMAGEVKNLKDTLDVGVDTLSKPSGLSYGVALVVDREDTTQSSDCMLNSVVVGIKGTSHFVRDVTCYDEASLVDLPMGVQDVILYSGDPKVVAKLREMEVPMMYYVTQNAVSLPEGSVQQVQWMTYSPINLSIFSEKNE